MSAASLAALPAPLRPTDDDWAKMLAAHVHLGTKNLDNKMVRCWAIAVFVGALFPVSRHQQLALLIGGGESGRFGAHWKHAHGSAPFHGELSCGDSWMTAITQHTHKLQLLGSDIAAGFA